MTTTTLHPLRALLHDEDIYGVAAGHIHTITEPYVPNLCPEWGGTDPLFGEIIRDLKPKLVFEIGSWKGASAITMARAAEEAALETHILCIDTWLGQTPSWTTRRNDPVFYGGLRMSLGYPRLYNDFWYNVVRHGMQDRITPLPATSRDAARILKFHKQSADLIYLDGSHEREDVAEDLANWSRRLNLGGHIFGHDYQMPGVRLSVDEFAKAKGLEVEAVEGSHGAKFWRLFQ